jgi:hypothetical protein
MDNIQALRFAIEKFVDDAQGKAEQVNYLEGVAGGSEAYHYAVKGYDEYVDAIKVLSNLLEEQLAK